MQRVVSFYEKLPRGAAPEHKAKGLIGRYQARYFGKNPSAARTYSTEFWSWVRVFEDSTNYFLALIHAIVFLLGIGYAQNYYFHLRHHKNNAH